MDFHNELKKLSIELSSEESKKFELYYDYLIEINQVMNLTAITEKDQVYRKHFLDSLQIVHTLKYLPQNISLCDVGSGAGFPSIPLAIINPKVEVTIIDALNKRIGFLTELIQKLNLKNVSAFHTRAEDYVKLVGPKYDLVTARAVAKLNVLAELCLPLTKLGGIFVAMKGAAGTMEMKEAEHAIKVLGGEVVDVLHLTLPDELEERQIIIIKKIKETPKQYPRNFNKIKEKPL
ncbi:MAG TPA: 16S rRNA (guanine(527)-N(7))-methyltransferase RsmG [Candidatus Pelethenecus sp.]|nr:16S rRNA (guanine(527)-N(7))-methyltransferase RsmG [Candidatus Pelethenecus sp.]